MMGEQILHKRNMNKKDGSLSQTLSLDLICIPQSNLLSRKAWCWSLAGNTSLHECIWKSLRKHQELRILVLCYWNIDLKTLSSFYLWRNKNDITFLFLLPWNTKEHTNEYPNWFPLSQRKSRCGTKKS
jgi:hypothetical protein